MSTVLAVSGSLRADSFNTTLLRSLHRYAPEGMAIEVYQGLDRLPHYNQDHESEPPAEAARLRAAVADADGVLISTPEYNRGIPGVLKDAIDWLSRPMGQHALLAKPVATLTASPGPQGGIRGLQELRRVLDVVNSYVVSRPELAISEVHTRLGADDEVGRALTDESTVALLTKLLSGLDYAIANKLGEHLRAIL